MKDTPVESPIRRKGAGMTKDELRKYREGRASIRRRRDRRRRCILGGLALAVMLVFVSFNWDKLAPASLSASVRGFFGMFAAGQFPLTFSSGHFKKAVPIGSNIAVLTDTSVTLYTPAGAQVWQRAHGMSNPALAANGSRAVLFDRGGKQFRVETRFSEPFSSTTDYPIVSACVGQSGRFAIVSESGSYLSEVNVFDATYHNIFKWDSTQGRVLNAALSPDGKSMAAVTVSAKDGVITSTLSIFRLDRQKPVAEKTVEGTLFLSLQYTDSGRIAAVGDNRADFFTADGQKDTTYSYDDKSIRCYYNEEGRTAVALGAYGSGSQSTLVSFSGDGKVAGRTDIAGAAQALYAAGGRLTMLRTSDVWYGTTKCKQQGTVAVSGDPLEALLLKNHIYVFGLQSVNRFAAKGS